MQLKIGNTKLSAGKYWVEELAKIEVNFEYLFASYKSYRRFANVVVDLETQDLKIKVKSEFNDCLDCQKLSRLLIGIKKIITSKNIEMIDQIIDGNSTINSADFLKYQEKILNYFL